MKKFKAPDLNAPRYREKRLGLLNKKTYNDFKEKYPAYKDVDNAKLKKIITIFNKKLWKAVIEYRDGVELPNSLGYLFIGTCEPSKNNNYNYALSAKHGKPLQQRNWETDGNIGKIFYTNWSAKYRFKFRELWRFEATRDFKRAVAKSYPNNWTKYIFVKTKYRVAHLFKRNKNK
ncbi:MAG: hypothetical protein HRT87_09390 [Legionellales bacterium]|nr:hypothetical protein [Legionellales bacterium]